MFKNILKELVKIICLVLIFGGFVLVINSQLNKIETNECSKWANESEVYENYYFTQNQLDQCKARGVELSFK